MAGGRRSNGGRGPTVSGPFPHGNRWRIVISRSAGGKTHQEVESFESEDAARDGLDRARRLIGARSCEESIEAYLEAKEAEGTRAATLTTLQYRLRAILGLKAQDRALLSVIPTAAERFYSLRVAKVAPDTHQGELFAARACWDWLVEQSWVAENPWKLVEPQGSKRVRPKDSIRVDEARRLLRVALAEGSSEGVAVAMALLLGMRASEVTSRVVRDVDDDCRLLWVPCAKTPAGVRQVVVPEIIRQRLKRLIAGRKPTDLLWGLNERGKPCDRHWLEHHTVRLCGKAKVPTVRPHALRGLHATIATVNGVAVEAVAKALGHASPAVTRRHYIAPGTEEAISASVMDGVLDGDER